VGVLLLLGCLPSLLLNAGTARSILLHDHHAGSLHTHVVVLAGKHAPGHGSHHGEPPVLAGWQGHAWIQPVEQHGDTVIPGAEAMTARKPTPAAKVGLVQPVPVAAFLSAAAASGRSSSLRPGGGASGGTAPAQLICLRTVILLI
jgi:hypothetical protein